MIKVENVSMKFRMNGDNVQSLKEFAINFAKGKTFYKDFWVFKDINFEVKKGEVVGIIGRNGAGKSTLLKIISGILTPTQGKVTLNGKVVPMLELGSGFDFELTGRENIFLNGSILGYSEQFLNEKYDEIVEFSELGEFIDTPIRNYSSGMMMRLAFAIATIVQPEILIVDEILAVGDEAFQKKSKRKMLELMGGGTTVLFVSHSIAQIREMCNRVVWLEKGQVKMQGDTKLVCDEYQKYINPVEYNANQMHKASDAPKNLADVLFVYGDDEKAYEWRVTNQREQLVASAIASNEIYDEDITDELAKLYRVFVCVRCRKSSKMLSFLELTKKYNKTVLFDISICSSDDNKENVLKKQDEVLKEYTKYCGGVIVSNTFVGQMYERKGYKVFVNKLAANEKMVQYASWSIYDRDVLPNLNPDFLSESELINYNRAKVELRKRKELGVCIGFFDGDLSSTKFQKIKETIKQILNEKDNSFLMIEGTENSIPEDMKIYQKRIIYKTKVDQEDIFRIYADADIILHVVNSEEEVDDTIERAIYAGLVKTPFVIYTSGKENSMDYSDMIVCNDEESCKDKILTLIENPELYRQKKEMLCQNVSKKYLTVSTGDYLGRFIRTQMKSNIAFVITDRSLWGSGSTVLHHAMLMQERGYDVEIIVSGKDQKDILYEEDTRIPVISRNIVYAYQYIDKIVAFDAESVRWMQNYGNVGKRYYVVQGYETDYYDDGLTKLRSNQMYTPHTNIQYITTSLWCRKWLKEKYHRDSVYISNGVSNRKYGDGTKQKNAEKIRVLISGNQRAEADNLEEAFTIADKLDRNRYEILFYSYGQEPYKHFQYDKLYQNITIKEREQLFSECDILLLTCRDECFHTEILEVMAAGGIVIARKDNSNAEYLDSGINCLIYEQMNIEEAICKIKEITDHSILKNRIIENAKQTAEKYEWKLLDEDIVNIYER